VLRGKIILVFEATVLLLSISFSPIVSSGILRTSPGEISMNLTKTIIVPDDFPTTQETINTDEDGDTILAGARTYRENMVVVKMVNVTAIDGLRRTNSDDDGEDIAAQVVRRGVRISGYTLRNSRPRDAGLFQEPRYNTLRMNTVTADGRGRVLNVSNGNHIHGDNCIVGNYWSDYTGVDGVSGSSYFISGGDDEGRYPSMVQPLNSFSSHLVGLGLDDVGDSGQLMFSGDVIVVPDDYPTIQEAVDHAVDGDTIIVRAGVYYENVIVDKQLKIRGEGSSVTFVDGGGEDKDVFYVISDHVEISGFTIRNSSFPFSGVELAGADFCVLYDNVFRDCGGSGIELRKMQGNMVQDNDEIGVELRYSSNNIISGNNISNNWRGGIELRHSSNNVISGNNISNNGNGIYLRYSSNNVISGNNIISNKWEGIELEESDNNIITDNFFLEDGLILSSSYQNIVNNNTVNHKPLIYLERRSDMVVDLDAGQVILVDCGNITVQNQNISKTDVGIQLWATDNCIIKSNNISNNLNGIMLCGSIYNTILGNNIISNNEYGIELKAESSRNTISGNNISNNDYGIYLWYSSNNTISRNNIISNNLYGIELKDSSDNVISRNNISNNDHGIKLSDSSDNTISRNNIISNNEYGVELKAESSRNTISGNNISNNDYGIYLWYSSDNTISRNNIISNNEYGVELKAESSRNTISGNNISNNDFGILLWDSSDNTISVNDISNNICGIFLSFSSNNVISRNNISNNLLGILLPDSSNNVISRNNISNNLYGISPSWLSSNNVISRNNISNNQCGVLIRNSRSNKVSYNNFIENDVNAYFEDCFFNRWNKNYWDDWVGRGPKIIYGIIKVDGVSIPWLNFDWHPAKEPYTIGD
jgi:parallel beta-helix repeat protein